MFLYRFLRNGRDAASLVDFLFEFNSKVSYYQRRSIIKQLYVISDAIPCPHTQHEIISFIKAIFSIRDHVAGCLVEAGSYKGGSTAKFSIAARMANRKLVVFDSFEGLPENNEDESLSKGSLCGTLDEVRMNISRFGELEVCELINGWFDDTMPRFSRPIVGIYLDVDLASSTRTCLKHLYQLLVPGGVLYSQDGHLPLVIDVYNDNEFWQREVGCPRPRIEGLGKEKLIRIMKPVPNPV